MSENYFKRSLAEWTIRGIYVISLYFLVLLLLGQTAKAQEAMSIFRSYRSLAMGNTGVANAADSAALFYNPAILAGVKGSFVDYAAFTLEASQGFTLQDALPMMIAPAFPFVNRAGLSDSSKLIFVTKTNPYLRTTAGVNGAVNLAQEGFTIAGSYFTENIATIPSGATDIYQRNDEILKVGFSYPIGLGQLVMGVAASRIKRRVSDHSPLLTTTWSPYYSASSYDIGLLYRMANSARITWGLAAMNIGGVTFGASGITEPQQITFGVSMNQNMGNIKLVPAVDIRQIGATTGKTNTLHIGLEIGMLPNETGGSALSARFGLNQGYLTKGIEMNMLNHSLIIGATQYGEEIGVGAAKLQNQRTILYFSMGF